MGSIASCSLVQIFSTKFAQAKTQAPLIKGMSIYEGGVKAPVRHGAREHFLGDRTYRGYRLVNGVGELITRGVGLSSPGGSVVPKRVPKNCSKSTHDHELNEGEYKDFNRDGIEVFHAKSIEHQDSRVRAAGS